MTETATLVTAGAMSPRRRISRRRRGTLALKYALLVAVLFLMLAPIVWPTLTSFKGPDEPVFGPDATVFPQEWSLNAYIKLFTEIPVLAFIANSLALAALSVVGHVVFATMTGYMLSRQRWRGRTVITAIITAALIFPFESIMLYLYTQVQALGLLDTIVGVWLPGIVGVFNVLVMRTAFSAIPDAIEEAAFMDGAGEFRRFFSIFLPGVKGALVIIVLTSFIGAWDDFLWPLMVLQSTENFTLTLGLSSLSSSFGFDFRVVLAGAVVALVPVVIIFLACQRFFFRGVEEGGVKF